jgi:hypothetical protein
MEHSNTGAYEAVCALIREIPGGSDATVMAREGILSEMGARGPDASPQELQDAARRIREQEGYGRSMSHCLMAVSLFDPEHMLTQDGLSALRAMARSRT